MLTFRPPVGYKQDKLITRVCWYPERTSDPNELKENIKKRLKEEFGVPVEVEFMSDKEVMEAAIKLHVKIIRS